MARMTNAQLAEKLAQLEAQNAALSEKLAATPTRRTAPREIHFRIAATKKDGSPLTGGPRVQPLKSPGSQYGEMSWTPRHLAAAAIPAVAEALAENAEAVARRAGIGGFDAPTDGSGNVKRVYTPAIVKVALDADGNPTGLAD